MAPRSGTDMPSPTIEDYLHAIYSLEGEGEVVISARLARRMRVTPPTAWATVQRMARDGLVTLDGKKVIHLTDKGRRLAEDIVRRHRLAERFLTDVLGLGWADCHEEAHLFEHALTPRLEERIVALLGNPTTCPHGSPIPGLGGRLPADLVPLAAVPPGEEATVEFISEELEEDADLLRYLERGRIMPGRRVVVREVVPASDLMVLESEGQPVPLGLKVAQKVRVRRSG
ncbi:Iron-dependent repressor IdeR [bacterium HR24]|nr:Iron-dependent repressor IdeR [bacterium HR24]